jgi:DNA-binding transcriptional regulator YhcF (GntR family)
VLVTAVDLAAPQQPYEQIAEDLRRKIKAGVYRPGDRLPSHKAMAEEYGSATETVRRALGVLRDEGLTATQGTRGTFVLREAPELPPDPEVARLLSGMQGVLDRLGAAEEHDEAHGAAIAELRADVAALRAHLMNLYHSVGQPYPYEEGAGRDAREVG